MSLTTQLKSKDSPINKFFSEFSELKDLNKCLNILIDNKEREDSCYEFKASGSWVYSVVGMTVEYLIKYAANKNSIDLRDSIAKKSLKTCRFPPRVFGDMHGIDEWSLMLSKFFEIGKKGLKATKADSKEAITSATSLAMLDALYRAGKLPKKILDRYEEWRYWETTLNAYQTFNLKKARLILDYYIKSLTASTYKEYDNDGDITDDWNYHDEVRSIIEIFYTAKKKPLNIFYRSTVLKTKSSLENAKLVNGADIDLLVKKKKSIVLLDIKTKKVPIRVFEVKQLISYALLYEPIKDGPKLTDIGIYYSRTGSYKNIELNDMTKLCFPKFNNFSELREKLINYLSVEYEARPNFQKLIEDGIFS